tara:strand:+ start:27 stop:632 length:606 start_codon:yes stop_codon:yes gene_type:complete
MNIRDEKFYYNDLTYFISERILECINEGIKSNWGNVYWPYPTKILNDSYSVEYKWEMHRVKQDHRWDVVGYAGPNESFEPSVEFHFLLKKGIWSRKAGISKAAIINVVAHELHHIAQGYSGDSRNLDEEKPYEYFLLPHEIEAFHVGFRAESDFTGHSMKKLMKEYLSGWIAAKDITKKQSNTIIDAWLKPQWSLVNVDLA